MLLFFYFHAFLPERRIPEPGRAIIREGPPRAGTPREESQPEGLRAGRKLPRGAHWREGCHRVGVDARGRGATTRRVCRGDVVRVRGVEDVGLLGGQSRKPDAGRGILCGGPSMHRGIALPVPRNSPFEARPDKSRGI